MSNQPTTIKLSDGSELDVRTVYRFPDNSQPRTFIWDEHNGWGNIIFPGWPFKAHGFLSGSNTIRLGDFLQGKMESGKTAECQVVELNYRSDPFDLWFAKTNPIRYVEDEPRPEPKSLKA